QHFLSEFIESYVLDNIDYLAQLIIGQLANQLDLFLLDFIENVFSLTRSAVEGMEDSFVDFEEWVKGAHANPFPNITFPEVNNNFTGRVSQNQNNLDSARERTDDLRAELDDL